ncbi:MAG: hypothetical protein M3Q29_08125 [Chloroflexota bacterium]|nr:hypothetical protein [Chloroflexota bacterium]
MEVVRLTGYDAEGYVAFVTEVPAGSEVMHPELVSDLVATFEAKGYTVEQETVGVE